MNSCKTAELPLSVGICLNAVTMSTEEYTIGHFSQSPSPALIYYGCRAFLLR